MISGLIFMYFMGFALALAMAATDHEHYIDTGKDFNWGIVVIYAAVAIVSLPFCWYFLIHS